MTDGDDSTRHLKPSHEPFRSSQEHLSRLFDLSLDLLCVAATDGFFRLINPAFESLLGFSREELLSRAFIEFVHPEDRPATQGAVQRLARGLTVVDFQNRYRTADGEYRWLAWRAAPDPRGELIYAVARDITERKKADRIMRRQAQELARSNADLEQFAYAASHDLRAPLRAVSSLASWIEEDTPGELSPAVRSHLQKLKDQVQRMEKLTEELLRYARAGQGEKTEEEIEVAALVDDIVKLLSPPEGFRISVQGGQTRIRTVRSALAQVLQNLISNAIDHHDRTSGRIEISVETKNSTNYFQVTDDGPGVPRDFVDDLFQMFSRYGKKESHSGTGMGLALVKKIIEGQGGKISYVSGNERGSCFQFTWPGA